jgi:hypothetical protein
MRHCVLIVVLALFAGCDRESQPTGSPDASTRRANVNQSYRVAEIAVSALTAAQVETQVSETDARWQSERYSQQVDRYLTQLNDDLIANKMSESTLAFVDDAIRGALVPKDLTTVHEDSVFVVRRWIPPDSRIGHESNPQIAFAGKTELQSSLAALIDRDSSESSDRTHGKFKIIAVKLDGQQLETDVLWQLSIPHAGMQKSVRWNCRWRLSSDGMPKLSAIKLLSFEEVRTHDDRQFADATAAVTASVTDFVPQFGPTEDYWLDRLENRFGILPTSYQGIAIADVNGDGLDDVYLAQPGGVIGGLPNRLFVQQLDGTVVDQSAESGLDWLIETHSALFVDFDNDGDQDVVVATAMGLVFAENDGNGRFERRTVKLTPDAAPMSLAAADFDHDQDLDVYVCCYSLRGSSPMMGTPIPYHDANNGGRNLLLRNDREWRFRDVTQQVGMNQNNRRFSFAAVWEDFDNDGDLDIYVANDYGRNNLFRNNDNTFRDVAAEFGVEDISAGMSAAWGDYDRDGWMDLYVSNMWSSAGHRIAYQRQFKSSADSTTLALYQRHARGNSLFSNQLGMGQDGFDDVSVVEGVTMGRWAWCSQFADINNDGHEDLLVANGFVTQEKKDDL